jgi:hypothetical protein
MQFGHTANQNYVPMTRLFSTLLILFSLPSFAQTNIDDETERFFRFGVKGGLNINKIQGKSFSDAFSYNYVLGGFLQFNVSRKWGIQPEVNFSQSTSEITNDNTEIYDDLFLGGEQKKAKLDYLKIPVLVNFDLGPSQRVKLQAGPQWSQLLSSKVDSLRNPNQSIFKKGDFSLLGGIWIQLPLVHVGARYEHGLTNVNDDGIREKWRNQAFHIFAGLTF